MFADLVSEFEQCGHHPPPQHSPASGEVGGGELALVSQYIATVESWRRGDV